MTAPHFLMVSHRDRQEEHQAAPKNRRMGPGLFGRPTRSQKPFTRIRRPECLDLAINFSLNIFSIRGMMFVLAPRQRGRRSKSLIQDIWWT